MLPKAAAAERSAPSAARTPASVAAPALRPSQSHLGKKWNEMKIKFKTIEGGSLCPLFYVPLLKK